jgi:hypothetical protein
VKPERGVHSEKLLRALSAHRSAALQSVLADNPRFALVGLLATLVPKLFGFRVHRCDAWVGITATPCVEDVKETCAAEDALRGTRWLLGPVRG